MTINTIGQKYVIGNRDDASVTPTNGNIAQTLVYNRALSATEILNNYNATKSRFNR